MEKPHVLFVDDEREILDTFKRQFRKSDFSIHTLDNAHDALSYLENNCVDIVVSDMRMPNMSGSEFLAKACKQWPDTIRILLTGYSDIESVMQAINEGAIYNYQTKPWDLENLKLTLKRAWEIKSSEDERKKLVAKIAAQNNELKTLNDNLEQKVAERTKNLDDALLNIKATHKKLQNNYRQMIIMISKIIQRSEKSNEQPHSHAVANDAKNLAELMKLPSNEIYDIYIAGLLHDIGLLGMPARLRETDFELLAEKDKEIYQKHPIYGEATLIQMDGMDNICTFIRQHHEKIDGSGYPDGLCKDSISKGAQILSLVNEYHDLLSGKQQLNPIDKEAAILSLLSESKSKHDTDLVRIFSEYVQSTLEKPEDKEMVLGLSQLKEGMKLNANLTTNDGILLLSAGVIMNLEIIRKLKRFEQAEGTAFAVKVLVSSDALD